MLHKFTNIYKTNRDYIRRAIDIIISVVNFSTLTCIACCVHTKIEYMYNYTIYRLTDTAMEIFNRLTKLYTTNGTEINW